MSLPERRIIGCELRPFSEGVYEFFFVRSDSMPTAQGIFSTFASLEEYSAKDHGRNIRLKKVSGYMKVVEITYLFSPTLTDTTLRERNTS